MHVHKQSIKVHRDDTQADMDEIKYLVYESHLLAYLPSVGHAINTAVVRLLTK